MVTDLHAHYPMRVVSDVTPDTALGLMRKAMRRVAMSPIQPRSTLMR